VEQDQERTKALREHFTDEVFYNALTCEMLEIQKDIASILERESRDATAHDLALKQASGGVKAIRTVLHVLEKLREEAIQQPIWGQAKHKPA